MDLEQEQMSLLTADQRERVSFLQVVKDNKKVEMSVEDVFDTETFHTFKAVTFVASPKIFFRLTNAFKNIDLILGIEDGEVSNHFKMGLQDQILRTGIEFWGEIESESIKDEIRKGQYNIRYTKKDYCLHSKFYLLEGNNKNRLVLGSANFTEKALIKHTQFEELLVFDNHELFPIYQERYNDIREYTNDFIPDKVKFSKERSAGYFLELNQFADLLQQKILQEPLEITMNKEQYSQLEDISDNILLQKESNERAQNLITIITKADRKTGGRKPKSEKEIHEKLPVIKTTLSRTNEASVLRDKRLKMFISPRNKLIYKDVSTAEKQEQGKEDLLLLSEKQPVSIIEKEIKNMMHFIDAYTTFTVREDAKTPSKVLEAILYSFMSHYIWLFRDIHHYEIDGTKSSRRYFPLFLIISGGSGSGKTSILEYISRLLGHEGYIQYSEVKKGRLLQDYFHSSSISPILIDEMESNYFHGAAEYNGEKFIKAVANGLEGEHPCLIGTTNSNAFSLPDQVVSRLYYLQMKSSFDQSKMKESNRYLKHTLDHTSDALFRDFSWRMANRMEDNEKLYEIDDILMKGREIFKEYFQEINTALPAWFPETPFHDYRERGKLIWSELFRTYREHFDIRQETIFVNVEKMIGGNKRSLENIINYLPNGAIIEQHSVLLLRKDIFFEFIKQHKDKKSFRDRWKQWFPS